MSMSTEVKVYTLNDVADILKVTRRTLYNYINTGKLKAVKVGKSWYVSEENLRELIFKGTE